MGGWPLVAQGQHTEGIARLQQGLAAYRATGTNVAVSYLLALLAEAYVASNQVGAGLRVLDEAFALVDTHGERDHEAELYRLHGELLRNGECEMRNAELTPESCFLKALDVARHQQAKSLELRATMSLARLWQSQGKRQEAYELLEPVYGWFTEGFDTADLKDAKALLMELGG